MRTTSKLATILLLGATAFVSSCAADAATPADSSPAESPAPTVDPTVTFTTGSAAPVSNDQIDPGLQPYIDIAVADLAARLSIDASAVAVTSATLVEWGDSSLGCPAPGQEYAKVTTDGALIVLDVDGKAYQYHAGGSRTPFLCEKPGKPMTPPSSTTL